MFLPAGGFIIGKIHKLSHTIFLLKGKILVATEDGSMEYTAPCYINATAGIKRAGYALEDTIWVNVHPNPDNTQDIKILENRLACSSYEEYNAYKLLNE
jgi:quercetin dioxygenase-like cupin family protein